MNRKRDKNWTATIATKQWFGKLFTNEADALVDKFGNNPHQILGLNLTQLRIIKKETKPIDSHQQVFLY